MNTLCFGGQFSDWISSHTNHKVAKVSENNRFCLLLFLHSEIINVFYRQDLSWTLGAKAQQKRKKHVKNSPILRRHFHEIKSSHHYYFWSVAFSLSAVAIGWRIISWQKSWAEGRFNITGWLFHKLGKGAEWSTEAETDLLSTRTALSPRLSTGISHRRARSLSSISVVKELKESEQKKQEWQ